MRTDIRRAAGAVVAAAAVAVTTGCSGGSGSSSARSTGPASSPAAGSSSAPAPATPGASPSGGLAAASADEILAQARQALLDAGSVHAKGTVRSGDTPYKLDLQMVRRIGAAGSVAEQGASLGVVRIKDAAYVQLDQASWRAVTGSASTARKFAGKYLKVTSSNSDAFKPFLTLTDVDHVFDSLLVPAGTVTKGAVTTVNGRKAVDLRIDGGRTGDVYVALEGRPYPLRLSYGRGSAQQVNLDSFGRKIALKAPPASRIASS